MQREISISPRVPLVEVLMITNKGYWLLMVKDELCNVPKIAFSFYYFTL